jgi:hypothetical protein
VEDNGSFTYYADAYDLEPYGEIVTAVATSDISQWNFYAISINGPANEYLISVNGIIENYTLSFTPDSEQIQQNIEIGRIKNAQWSENYFNGSIDEVQIWNRSLSADEISQIYMSNLYKYNLTQWYLNVNQSKNATAGLSNGNYTYQAFATDLNGKSNQTEQRTITIDATYPTFSNYLDDNATIAGSGTAHFNVTVVNTNGTVLLEINNTNYTASNISGGGSGAVAFDSANNSGDMANQLTKNWSHTTSGTNRYLVVGLAGWNATGNLNSVTITYAGVAMTRLGGELGNGVNNAVLYGLVNPALGTNYVNVSNIPASFAELGGGSVSFTGVDQNSPNGTVVVNVTEEAGAYADLGIISNGDIGIDIVYDEGTAGMPSAGVGGTMRVNTTMTDPYTKHFMMQTKPSGGTVIMNWTGGDVDTLAGVAVKAASVNYNVSVPLTAGTYPYQWISWGSGASHLLNISETRSYTVNASGNNALLLNFTSPTLPNATITSNTSIHIQLERNELQHVRPVAVIENEP